MTAPQVSLPIGISFYTFQTLSYVIDVYRGQVAVQRSYRDFLLYVSLFPQLIAGPIVRYSEIEPQLSQRKINYASIFYGLLRFCIGLAKKVLLANYAGKVATQLLGGTLSATTTLGGWLGILMYTFQIYFDFSGYSDMAIGLGRVFGFRYSENFDLPYMSRSITEFWRRWHISLGSFFRDYVYIPLGGNRRHHVLNLLVVWTLTGLWHGASWNFALWGLYFFVLLYIEKSIPHVLEKIPTVLRCLGTFFLVVLGWVLFYCTNLTQLGQTFGLLFGQVGIGFTDTQMNITLLNNLPLLLVCILGSTPIPRFIGMIFSGLCAENPKFKPKKRIVYTLVVYGFDLVLLGLSIVSLIGSSFNPFLYFRF
ncbi:MBOAT family O-acyltransferase [Candidatus Avoscillospira sp. LCP25S3_F1]|uniref:MBOAT family O-acyltransferase n=1 Tax=Candidatus Avoscillospira sp. LCP25S3_F1 TaxID=3438825 RepID=UPI003F8DEE93